MRIGFTYDLLDDYLARGFDPVAAAEFDKPETIDAVTEAVTGLGHEVARLGGLDSLVRRLAAGERWDLVFNIAEGVRGPTRESQVPALLEAYGVPATFADSLCLAVCLHKGYCKTLLAAAGVPGARFTVLDAADVRGADPDLAYPLFVKPVAEGTGKGVSAAGKVGSPAELRERARDLTERFRQPVLVEEFLPGREFTVGVVGTGERARVLGVMEVLLRGNAEPEVYSFDNKDRYLDRVDYRLAPPDAESRRAADIALESYRRLGCRDAGRVDIRSDAGGNPMFLEINPLAGLNPVHSDLPILCRLLGVGYQRLLAEIVDSALLRVAP